MSNRNIYLIGFMGTGKTTVGKLLAKNLRRPFVEMDEEIEKREGKKIVEIFSLYGESYFRKLEKEVLIQIAKENNLVVSCGGGLVCDEENLQILKSTGIVFLLEASPEVIYARTKHYAHRPLLNVENPRQRIEQLLKVRLPFYRQAHYSLDTSTFSPEQVVAKITQILEDG
jgi:shikimate kinase